MLSLPTYFLFAFFLGGFLGTGGSVLWNKRALWWPSALTLLLSVGSLHYYNALQSKAQKQQQQAEFAITCKKILPADISSTSTDLKAPVALPPLVDDSTDTEDASDDGNSGPEHMRLASFSS